MMTGVSGRRYSGLLVVRTTRLPRDEHCQPRWRYSSATLIALAVVFSPLLRQVLGTGLSGLETLMARFSFGDSSTFSWRFPDRT